MQQYLPYYKEPIMVIPQNEQHNKPHNYPQPLLYPYSEQQYSEMERYSLFGDVMGKIGYSEAKSLLQNAFSGMIQPITEGIASSIAKELKGEIKDTVKDSVTGIIKDLVSAQTDQTKAFTECMRSFKNTQIEQNKETLVQGMQTIDDYNLSTLTLPRKSGEEVKPFLR